MGHDLDDEDDGSDFFKALDRHDAQQALIVKSGDTLVIRYTRRLNAQEADEIATYLRAEIPSTVKILLVEEDGFAVIRP